MAVFITGGHGHIGSWTAYLMAKDGEDVIVYDTNPVVPEQLGPVLNRITFIQGDVMDFPRLCRVFQEYKPAINGIIHTVAVMGEFVPQNPHYNVSLNIGSMLNVLEVARLFEIKKVVYTSTGAVYGSLNDIASEDKHLPNPADLYGATKVSAEYLGQQYEAGFGIDFRIGRVYFVYGPGKFPSNFIRLYKVAFGVLEGLEGLSMDRGRDQQLDFTYAEDAAQGVALLYMVEDLKHKTFNIATGVPHSVGEVIELARKYSRFSVKVNIGPGTLMPRCRALNITRSKKELGYYPKYSLEEGVKHYAEWLGHRLS